MLIWIEEGCMQLFIWLLQLNDAIFELFTTFTGVSQVSYGGDEGTLLDAAMTSSTVSSIMWGVIVLAVGLACVFTITALVRNMARGDKRMSGIVGKFLLAILGTLAVMALVIVSVMIVDGLLVLVSDVFEVSSDTKLSSMIFDACVEKWNAGYSIADFDVSTVKVSKILGEYKSAAGIWPTGWKGNGMIDADEFFYLPALISSVCVAVFAMAAVVQLARRLFECVFCYFTMPAALSVLPLDDGARFKNWRDTFISRIIMAFGTVISMNVFAILLPVLVSVEIPSLGNFGNAVFMIVAIIGGAMIIPAGQNLFVRIFGTREEGTDGVRMMSTVWHTGTRYVTGAYRTVERSATFAARQALKGGGSSYAAGESNAYRERDAGSDAYRDEGGKK